MAAFAIFGLKAEATGMGVPHPRTVWFRTFAFAKASADRRSISGRWSAGGSSLLAVVALSFWAPPATSLQGTSLKTVVQRVERYVDGYESELSTLVARERYVQATYGFRGDPDESRALISDFLFLRLPGPDGPWLGFRDVLEVDGRPLAHHQERLQEIVAASPESAASRAFSMSRESSRYNIGRLERTVNVPVCVLGWMHSRLRDHFAFRQDGEETVDGVRAWRIAFRERKRPTIVRDHLGKDVVSTGRIWVDAATGRVLQTEQENTTGRLHVRIVVEFHLNQDFGILVPVRMTEHYEDGQGRLETEATYSDYRRFGVTTRIR